MYVLITYDVSTLDKQGQRRLRQVAKTCEDWGQRVQKSVFECKLDPAQLATIKRALIDTIDPTTDSLRIYNLGANWKHRVEHVGVGAVPDLDGPLIT